MNELFLRYLSCSVRENVSLSQYCTFKAGGTAEFFVAPTEVSDIIKIMRARKRYQFPLFFLGGGSNVLISDVKGVVILSSGFCGLNYYESNDKIIVEAGSGYPLKLLVRESLRRGYSGLEFAVGIPGTVGGAVAGNAGTQGEDMGKLLLWASCVTPDGEIINLGPKELKMGYRYSSIGEQGSFITKCAFELRRGERGLIKEKYLEYWRKRHKQPFTSNSAGCIFKNTANERAGKLLDECGCKGMRVGDAVISEQHANFCINTGDASPRDIRELIYRCRDIVYEKKGILLDFEVKMLGFSGDEGR